MELEQRVRALELEMKILKNEVQRTLLDVQEQVLLNERPDLTIESKTSRSMIQGVEPLRTQPSASSAIPAVTVGSAASATPQSRRAPAVPSRLHAATAPVLPSVPAVNATAASVLKKVSLEEVRAAQSELEGEAMPTESTGIDKLVGLLQKPVAGSQESNNGDAATLAERGGVKLLEWLMSGATKVDGERNEKRVNEVLDKLSKLNSLVDRASTMEEALRFIEENELG